MPITDISVSDIAPFADGEEFGAAGAYVRIKGTARGTLDPAAPENAGIADLALAPRNAAGLVEWATDYDILRPQDPQRGSAILVYDVTNRGNKRILQLLDDAPPNNPAAAGLAFTLRRGYSLVWSGWDPGAPRAHNGLGGDFPVAPVGGRIRDEFHIGTRAAGDGASHRLPYPAASLDRSKCRLALRECEADRRRDIPADEWEFIDNRTIRLLPEGRKFAPWTIYEFWYEASEPKILGIGFASVRDLVSFLRYRGANRGGIPNLLLSGMSEI